MRRWLVRLDESIRFKGSICELRCGEILDGQASRRNLSCVTVVETVADLAPKEGGINKMFQVFCFETCQRRVETVNFRKK